jgi:uroporphyrinogen-III decarboxylase
MTTPVFCNLFECGLVSADAPFENCREHGNVHHDPEKYSLCHWLKSDFFQSFSSHFRSDKKERYYQYSSGDLRECIPRCVELRQERADNRGGDITSIIPDLIEIGVTILNPLQPECLNLKKLKKEFGAHLVFEGSIGTQSTMPFGTSDEIKRVIRERKKTLGYDGALIIAPTHILEPEVSLENIEAFVEACREK